MTERSTGSVGILSRLLALVDLASQTLQSCNYCPSRPPLAMVTRKPRNPQTPSQTRPSQHPPQRPPISNPLSCHRIPYHTMPRHASVPALEHGNIPRRKHWVAQRYGHATGLRCVLPYVGHRPRTTVRSLLGRRKAMPMGNGATLSDRYFCHDPSDGA